MYIVLIRPVLSYTMCTPNTRYHLLIRKTNFAKNSRVKTVNNISISEPDSVEISEDVIGKVSLEASLPSPDLDDTIEAPEPDSPTGTYNIIR